MTKAPKAEKDALRAADDSSHDMVVCGFFLLIISMNILSSREAPELLLLSEMAG